MSECPECGAPSEMVPMHDGLGTYYMVKRCSGCGGIYARFVPGEGHDLRDAYKRRAVRDPSPPPRTELESGGEV